MCNYVLFKAAGCGFAVNGETHIAAQIYVVSVMFILLR